MSIDPNTLPEQPLPRLRELMRILRSPSGCPWDRRQDHRSLRAHLLEEAWELLAVLDESPHPDDDHLCDELGDVLLQVVFHAQIADERQAFDLDRVADRLSEKLIRRHPHVFGDVEVDGSEQVVANWESIKRREGPHPAPGREGTTPLPALLDADRMLAKAERTGFRWGEDAQARAKVSEELTELEEAVAAGAASGIEAEFGDLLLALVSWGRRLAVDPESALRGAVGRFRERLERMEGALREAGYDPLSAPPEERLAAWDRVQSPAGPDSLPGREGGA